MSKISLEVEELNALTHESMGKKVLPADTFFFLYGTDGESFVDVTTREQRLYRIAIQRDASGYGWTVNGKNEADCFYELYYAG